MNLNASAESPYQMTFDPATIWHDFLFYVSHLLNPALALLALLAVLSLWPNRRQFILAVALLLAGFAAFATHSMLPHHLLREYSWVAAPLLLAPLLAVGSLAANSRWRSVQFGILILLAGFAIAGPAGFRDAYQTDDAHWIVAEDQKCAQIREALNLWRRRRTHCLRIGEPIRAGRSAKKGDGRGPLGQIRESGLHGRVS